jgi:hypothetical protein
MTAKGGRTERLQIIVDTDELAQAGRERNQAKIGIAGSRRAEVAA